jgi:rubrerythrin
MPTISDKTIEAIKTAIQMEEEGYQYYMDAAEATDNEMGQEMFRQLAKDEMTHRRTFEAMFDKLADAATWRKLASETPGVSELPVFKAKSKELQKSKGMVADANAVRVGMEKERLSIEYYEKAARETNDEQARVIFNNIMEQEEFHFNLLQAELDSLQRTGFWFDTAEFRMDGKF